MKIDIHTHTKKCKTGDAYTRNINADDLCNTILSTDIGIFAITNHNHFDIFQFNDVYQRLNGDAQVWPGVEFDVTYGTSTGHLLVIVSPKNKSAFDKLVKDVVGDTPLDTFVIEIQELVDKFDNLSPLYIAHYVQKKPCLSTDALDKLEKLTKTPEQVLREVTNSISAGIYISHGHPSIYGSDVQDWKDYGRLSTTLPDLRLPVDSFEHFCLLLKKDPTTINTALDRKDPELLTLSPFPSSPEIQIQAYNDINIIFGSKGTGKTCILNSIAEHYSKKGSPAKVYSSGAETLAESFDIKGKNLNINLKAYEIEYCLDEISAIREAREVQVTSISHYTSFFKSKITNKNAQRILIKDIPAQNESLFKIEFNGYNNSKKTVSEFIKFIKSDTYVNMTSDEENINNITNGLIKLEQQLADKSWESFLQWKETYFLNSLIRKVRKEVERKTGSPSNPTTTGFKEYALNRAKIEHAAKKILNAIATPIPPIIETVGSLGPNKGTLDVCTEFKFQNGNLIDSKYNNVSGGKKKSPKKFSSCLNDIYKSIFSDELFEKISELNSIEDIQEIPTVLELLTFKKYFSISGEEYTPSSGESSMIMLQKELNEEKDIYILDEPEKSLGNDYISEVIVPLIKDKAKSNRKIFISTHDANIAVRTLPFSSIYRCHERSGYKTYIGNPFINSLTNPLDSADKLDWKQISMKTLEGGEDAFGERGNIYGKN